ncbi:MAG: hypothetical protein ACI8P9_001448 [Parasphingorhabdus sp.]|jgi:hypothetical protein
MWKFAQSAIRFTPESRKLLTQLVVLANFNKDMAAKFNEQSSCPYGLKKKAALPPFLLFEPVIKIDFVNT